MEARQNHSSIEMKLFLIATILNCCLADLLANDTLILVHVVFRHCERTPDIGELYPESPYYNESTYAPYGYGQLTNEGKKHCYNVGRALRQRYQNFLSASYRYSKVEGISSSYIRTKESLQLVLAGLFPPTEELTWSTELNWVPIATYYTEKPDDMIVLPYLTNCFMEELDMFEKSDEGLKHTAHLNELMEYMQKHTKLEQIDFRKTAYMMLGMELMIGFGLDLPNWMNGKYPNISKKYYNQYLVHQYSTKKLKRMACGYLLKKIVEETEMKISGTSGKEILIYSGHDVTINSLLVILDVWDETSPPVGTYCALEVHNINGTYGFKLFYSSNTSDEPYQINIPGFGEFVPLNELKNQRQEYLHLDDLKRTSNSVENSVYIFNLVFVFILNLITRLF